MIYNTCKCPEYFPPKLRHGHKNGVLLNTKKVGFIVFFEVVDGLVFLDSRLFE